MKVKFFFKMYHVSYEDFSNEINEFIKDKNIIDIKFQKTDNNTYVLVLYEE